MGEWTSNAGTEWTFISVPMIIVAEELPEGYTINLPQGAATWIIDILDFVDDKRQYVNNFQKECLKSY